MPDDPVDVAIVGAGPVGLYLGALLLQSGVRVRVVEQRVAATEHSRAIGIHPPALAALAEIDVSGQMMSAGQPIRGGIALSRGREVGRLDFGSIPSRYPFVLALPQTQTEDILAARVAALDPTALRRGVKVTAVADDGGTVRITAEPAAGAGPGARGFAARLVIVADGAKSTLRASLPTRIHARTYPDHYLMGDFADDGRYGHQAVLFLEPGGIVESFPLPGGLRRWVVRLGASAVGPGVSELVTLVADRTGVELASHSNSMLSAFSVRTATVAQTVHGNVVLLGDAAHEISPIGGQGMNLGWLDAQALAPLICRTLAGAATNGDVAAFEAGRRRAANRARQQAGINMALGRPAPAALLRLRNAGIGALASIPSVNRMVARRFTML
ncbi:Pentachlorophenol 4-monooxygenase [Arthrobacter ulcerisalmonis]|uniref:Pentachlorophenol 4-monooxygenase n=1 Tax=Arthrobacter ulcerisalmonis TaxID=2483813 RepID=A0A3P5XLD6_9MICC|nr:NAD(P)/FAD-dependent oxidoreductase [Arthrobacter ulcerisalmonis]VDC31033.1 Pentachlorophenol 4-monooxygenase [Arthrobacter ulcerisalmonis]